MRHAIRDKVLLQLLRTLDINNSLREKQENGCATIVEEVERTSYALKGLTYALQAHQAAREETLNELLSLARLLVA